MSYDTGKFENNNNNWVHIGGCNSLVMDSDTPMCRIMIPIIVWVNYHGTGKVHSGRTNHSNYSNHQCTRFTVIHNEQHMDEI